MEVVFMVTKKKQFSDGQKNYKNLPQNIRNRLVLENCEKMFSVEDCLRISGLTNVPVVFDTHHFECYKILHENEEFDPPSYYMERVLETWKKRGIKPKFHISEQGTGRIGHHSDYVEVIPKYLMEIPEKYGFEIDIMIEAKFKELSLFHLYEKYPELNCAVSGEIPKDLFVPKPTVPRSELQKIKKAKKATEKEVGKIDEKRNKNEKKPLKRKINKPQNDEALSEKKVESKKNSATITKVKSTSVQKKKKKVATKKKSLSKLKNDDEITSDECSDTSLDSNKSVEIKKRKKEKQNGTSKANGAKREVSRKSSRKRKEVSYALSDNSDE